MQEKRQQLNGLAQTHVVGQTTSEPKSVEERQPRQTTLLVGAKFTLKGIWLLNLGVVGRTRIQEFRDPTRSLNAGERDAALFTFPSHSHGFENGALSLPGRGQSSGGVSQDLRVQFNPLVMHPSQNRTTSCFGHQRLELIKRQDLIAHRDFPFEINQGIQTKNTGSRIKIRSAATL